MYILYLITFITIMIPITSFFVIRYVSKTPTDRQVKEVKAINQIVIDHKITLVNIKDQIHEAN